MKILFNDFREEYQAIKEEMDEAVFSVLNGGRFIGGEIVEDFESRFADFTDSKYCVGCGNGTDALEIILEALEIGPGHEVLVPACSWISSSEVVSRRGARPVFVDVLDDYYTIDPERLVSRITSATKAIIPVHLYGLPAEMDPIMQIAEEYGLKVVEDCAHAHGARYKSRPVGSFGVASAFSFYPTKNLGAYGDGGAIVTSDPAIRDRVRMIANHGQTQRDHHVMEGRNSRLDVLQAAVLRVKLRHLPSWNQNRRSNADMYDAQLKGKFVLPSGPSYSHHVYHLYVIRVPRREKVQRGLSELGIQTMVHYPTPLPFLPAYQRFGYKKKDFPVAAAHQSELLSIPVNPFLKDSEVSFVSENLARIIDAGS